MPDLVLYNAGGIEGAIAAINSLNAAGQDAAQQMAQQYRLLDEAASGRATQAGLDFQTQAHQIRDKAHELTQTLNNAVMTSHSDMQDLDGAFMSAMG